MKKADLTGQGRAAVARRRMTGGERKDQIVKVATSLFARKGFKGTTTREIAEKAGISEAVIFKHFARKEDLYNAIIDSRCADGQGQSCLAGMLKGKRGRDFFKTMASFLINEHQKDSSFLRLLFYSALEHHDFSEMFIKTRGMQLVDMLDEHITELIREGELKKTDSAVAARAFLGMVLHYSISQELYGLKRYFRKSNKDVVDIFVDIFFDGMKRRR